MGLEITSFRRAAGGDEAVKWKRVELTVQTSANGAFRNVLSR